jgi:hypothetical protein
VIGAGWLALGWALALQARLQRFEVLGHPPRKELASEWSEQRWPAIWLGAKLGAIRGGPLPTLQNPVESGSLASACAESVDSDRRRSDIHGPVNPASETPRAPIALN